MDKETEMTTDNAVSNGEASAVAVAATAAPKNVVKLTVPVVRGDVSYSEIKIGPLANQAGSLRGLSLLALY
ncbi:TPA: hypothetical protein ACV8FS_005643, partial [Escherichia coli]